MPKKSNREALRRLMGQHDITADQVARILGKASATIHQYRSTAGVDISAEDLARLRAELEGDSPAAARQ